ncbi:DUF6262 family protein [Actinomadura litoris]|uniref:DUF6262 family protein n=1 Tax=Actinomadura litoris TaxID=2678616 RepID=UPI001FA7B6C0|nr:DUF6262 family protein [Actinomadura litoris]
MTSTPMARGRQAATDRRRASILKAINDAITKGDELSVSAIARRAGVDRTYLYRHRDLLEQIHTANAQPTANNASALVTRASMQADLANAQERNRRLDARVRHLEKKLSEHLGEQAWRESGLGAPDDIDQLKRRITELEQRNVDLADQLTERDDDLDAARAANRELIGRLNRSSGT